MVQHTTTRDECPPVLSIDEEGDPEAHADRSQKECAIVRAQCSSGEGCGTQAQQRAALSRARQYA